MDPYDCIPTVDCPSDGPRPSVSLPGTLGDGDGVIAGLFDGLGAYRWLVLLPVVLLCCLWGLRIATAYVRFQHARERRAAERAVDPASEAYRVGYERGRAELPAPEAAGRRSRFARRDRP